MATTIQLQEFGKPREVCKIVDLELPEPSSGEARVRMLYAPVNPADLNYIEGTYGIRPPLPATPGIEGVGEVTGLGDGVTRVRIGDRVMLVGAGAWTTETNVTETSLVPLPPEIDPVQASMLKVNPMTAFLMLQSYLKLSEGDWVIQNAANSGVGRCVIQLARESGWKTLNLVRRMELEAELKELGADEVFLDDEASHETIRSSGAWPSLGLNAVGGDSALRISASLQEDGCLVTYGAMGRKALKVPNAFLIFRNLSFHGFWLNRRLKASSTETIDSLTARLSALVVSGKLTQPVDQIYPMESFHEALARAEESGRSGKVILRLF